MADPVIDLVRRFEPILAFHPKERFFPCNAKRYIEHCALWKAEHPFDVKDSWGGKGKPFDRKPMLQKGHIAASDEAGEIRAGDVYLGARQNGTFPFLADDASANPGEQHFFELSGWKDAAGVTASSKNRYASRDRVAALYSRNADLADSRFWYHAELFETDRLRELMDPAQPLVVPNVAELFRQLEPSHPALLCYYFFFPAHDEALASPCSERESGKEYASYAGEWACMALLLGRASVEREYVPTHIGRTGRFTVGGKQGLDGERRFGMTVTPWQGVNVRGEKLPFLVGEHPLLYVSAGTHSLHLTPGEHPVAPYLPEVAPQSCGAFDSPDALDEFWKSQPTPEKDPSPAAGWAKILLGGLFGGIPGLIGGIIATAVEGLPLGAGFNGVATGSGPASTPTVNLGPSSAVPGSPVIAPVGLNLESLLPLLSQMDAHTWASDQRQANGGRHYDFIVDRAKQVWWPSDDGKSGYRGRWGPLVVDDRFHRRSGMLFPEFWRMFVRGLLKS